MSLLQGKGTEDTVNRYQGCQLLFLDIPNIHAVRDSLYRLQGVCESSAQKKWLSHLESTQWLAYITCILKVLSCLLLNLNNLFFLPLPIVQVLMH